MKGRIDELIEPRRNLKGALAATSEEASLRIISGKHFKPDFAVSRFQEVSIPQNYRGKQIELHDIEQ
jgi:hypothetical protein